MLFAAPFLAAVTLAVQAPDHAPVHVAADSAAAAPKSVRAVHASQQPILDGRDDDAVWRDAAPITQFQEWRPSEGGAPKLPTEAKIAYDAANLYVFVRCFDPHPDSIITVLARRDGSRRRPISSPKTSPKSPTTRSSAARTSPSAAISSTASRRT